jgi:hypothetical protein
MLMIVMRKTAAIGLSTLLLATSANAEVRFEFDYSKAAEFNDPDLGPARRASLEDAAFRVGSQFNNEATIQIEVTSEDKPESNTLASAGSNAIDAPLDFFGYFPAVVEKKIKEGIDDNGAEPDGVVTVNFGVDWDLDDQISESFFDFKATMIHELLHAMGFSSGIGADGTDVYFTEPGNPGVWSIFDEFITDRNGNWLIDNDFALDGDLWALSSLGGSSPTAGLFFSGPNALAANGGNPVGLFSPNVWEDGSSGSHLDDNDPALAGFLMLSATSEGPYTRTLTVIERAILTDLGYSVKEGGEKVDPPILSITIVAGAVNLMMAGDPGNYDIEGSSDMAVWEYLGTVTIEPDETEITLELDSEEGAQFFRALGSAEDGEESD